MFTRILCIFIVCIFIICVIICIQKNEEKSDKIDDLMCELDKLMNTNIPCNNCKYETDINTYIYSSEDGNILITTDKENNVVKTSKVKVVNMEEIE